MSLAVRPFQMTILMEATCMGTIHRQIVKYEVKRIFARIKAIANWAVNRAANFPIDTDIEAEENSES